MSFFSLTLYLLAIASALILNHGTCTHTLLFFQGPNWTQPAIWAIIHLLSPNLRRRHWRVPPYSLVVLAEEAAKRLEQIPLRACHSQFDYLRATCDGHQLLELDIGGLYLPILDQEASFGVVGEVQLCDECGVGYR